MREEIKIQKDGTMKVRGDRYNVILQTPVGDNVFLQTPVFNTSETWEQSMIRKKYFKNR